MTNFDEIPIFEIGNVNNDDRIKIYKNGLVEGLPEGYSLIINRIPQLETRINKNA